MQNCKYCGANIRKEFNYCPQCGNGLRAKAVKVKADDKGKASRKTNLPLYLAVAIAAVVVFVLLIPAEERIAPNSDAQSSNNAAEQLSAASEMHDELNTVLARLQQQPNDPALLEQAAHTYFDVGKYRQAIGYYNRAIQIGGEKPELIIDAGVCYFELSAIDTAEAYFDRALQIDPEHPVGLYNKGIVLSSRGDPKAAAEFWNKILEVAPESRQAEMIRGMMASEGE
jgi:tetratricopeptide (TPR) repeat protein